jgi:hypothetical protein
MNSVGFSAVEMQNPVKVTALRMETQSADGLEPDQHGMAPVQYIAI